MIGPIFEIVFGIPIGALCHRKKFRIVLGYMFSFVVVFGILSVVDPERMLQAASSLTFAEYLITWARVTVGMFVGVALSWVAKFVQKAK